MPRHRYAGDLFGASGKRAKRIGPTMHDPNTDLAINEMMLRIDEERGNFVKKIRENNGNIVAFVTALLLSMVIAQICFSIKGDAATESAHADDWRHVFNLSVVQHCVSAIQKAFPGAPD